MPGFDRTGPRGMGAKTGGARGLCTPRGRSSGRGGFNTSSGGGPGRSRGNRNMFNATGLPRWRRFGPEDSRIAPPAAANSNDQEMASLKSQASTLRDELEAIDSRLRDLESR